jgi:AcrR family transcriptional regulator
MKSPKIKSTSRRNKMIDEKSAHKAINKAEMILAGAMQEFTTHGFAAASMDRIAIAAGVSKPTLYSYFQDKEGLFTALIHQLLPEEFLLSLQDPILLQAPPRIFLRHLATTILHKFAAEQPLLTFIRLTLGESGRFPDLAQSFVQTIQKPMIERLSQYFEGHQDLHYSDPEIAARMFVGTLMHYVITHEILHGQEILPIQQDRLVDGLVDLIIREKKTLNRDR